MHKIPTCENSPHGHRLDARALLGLLLVCTLALVLRLHQLDAESLWMDEAAQVSFYRLPLQYVVLKACGQGQPPLDYVIGAGLHRLGLAGSDWWVRFPAALFGTGGVFLLGWMVSRIAGPFAGITAALLLSLCPLHVAMSQEARPYAIFFFFALAAILALHHALQRHTFRSWCVFGFVFLALLMTRGLAPHVLTLGLVAFSVGNWFGHRRPSGSGERHGNTTRLWAFFTAIVIPYAFCNLIIGVIYYTHRGFIYESNVPWLEQISAMLLGAYNAILAGETAEAVSNLPVRLWFLPGVAVFAAGGVVLLLRHARRTGDSLGVLFATTLVPFPFIYAMLYAELTGFPPKPQYLLLMAAPLFGAVAIAFDALRRRLHVTGRAVPWVVFALFLGAAGVPMGQASVRASYRQDKADWRRVLLHLRANAAPADAIASVRPHWNAKSVGAFVVGADRYLKRRAEILRIGFDTSLDTLQEPRWTGCDNTVWIICNKTAWVEEVLPAPLRPTSAVRVHDFHRLFILEIRGAESAADRLIEGLAFLDHNSPDRRGLVAPNLLRARFHLARGDTDHARSCVAAAGRHCRDDLDRRELDASFPESRVLQVSFGPPVD